MFQVYKKMNFRNEKQNIGVFLLATYSVYVPRLPPGSLHNMPDLRSASMNDMLPNQIPQNATYETPFQQQPSPISLSPESITSQGK